MMLIIKSVLFVRPLIPLIIFKSFINFIFVYKALIYIWQITLELAESSLNSLANLACVFKIIYLLASDFMFFSDWSRLVYS
jgi:hypothetical protein